MKAVTAAWRSQLVPGVACVATVGLTLCADLAIGRNIGLGIVATIPLAVAALRLHVTVAATVAAFAIVTRVVAVTLGDILAPLAVIESLSYIVITWLAVSATQSRRRQVGASPAISVTARPRMPAVGAGDHEGTLSTREHEVVAMTLRGLSAEQIGQRLFVSRRTVETHLARAYVKLGVESKRELAARAYDGIVQLRGQAG